MKTRKNSFIIAGAIALSIGLVGCSSNSHREPVKEDTINVLSEHNQTKEFDSIEKDISYFLYPFFVDNRFKVQRISDTSIAVFLKNEDAYHTQNDNLSSDVKKRLRIIADIIEEHENVRIVVDGHTDHTGIREINDHLSMKRAEKAATYLTGRGLESYQVLYDNWGSRVNINNNDTEDNKADNRRIELLIEPVYRASEYRGN